MNAIEQARKAYAPAQSHLRSFKSIEYQAFNEIIGRLTAAANGSAGSFPELASALHDNRALWSILAADVADPENALPQQLRAQIFYLAEFTEHHSRRVLRGEANADALIEINTAILRGLGDSMRGRGQLQEAN